MPVDWDAPLQTMSGDLVTFVRRLHTDDAYPMLVIVTRADGLEDAECYRADGTYTWDREPSPWDLINRAGSRHPNH